jgi:CO/xanthine dehydrogenase FAD-binding subunit
MHPFEYHAPATLPEALAILADFGGAARALAGGTDLLLKLKAERLAPSAVVNIKRVPQLHSRVVNSHVSLGALTTLSELRASPTIRSRLPALATAAGTMASVQIRNLATLGGNLCNAAPSADLGPILMALEATALIAGPQGERELPLEEFFTGPGQTALLPGELLTAVRIMPATGLSTYLKLAPRACMDIAVVGIGLALYLEAGICQRARIVLGAVAPTPLRARRAEEALVGQRLTAELIEHAAQLAGEAAQPIDDVRGTAWYRRRMVVTLTRRGLLNLMGRA